MTTRSTRPPRALALSCFLVLGCSGGDGQGSADSGTGESGSPSTDTHAPTMSAIYDNILSPRCAVPFCHLGIAGSPPIFSDKESSDSALVNVPARGTKCGGDAGGGAMLVVPMHPESSLLYQKIKSPSPAGLCGDRMPGGTLTPLPDADIGQIEQWIAQGATDD